MIKKTFDPSKSLMEKKINLKKSYSSTLSYHNISMNILKSSYLNSTTLIKIEIFDGKDFSLWFFLCVCKIS
jgi:hypothetical protein